MKIVFVLKESVYDCKLQITDTLGCRCYRIPAITEETEQLLPVEVYGEEVDLDIVPVMPNTDPLLKELDESDWKERLAKKAGKTLFAVMDTTLLRVGCKYHICGLQEGSRLELQLQSYVFGNSFFFELLDLMPVMYNFFEASQNNTRFVPVAAYETNRKDVIKAARTMALTGVLGNGFLATLITYPIEVSRVKRLCRNRKIFKVLSKFHNMSEAERQSVLEKQEKQL